MSLSEPLLYAELLPHIRQVSVIATLHSPSDVTTLAKLSTDGQQLLLDHAGVTKTLKLPGQTTFKILPKPSPGSTELSWRLPVAGPPIRADTDSQIDDASCSASCLTKDDEFLCRDCSAVLIKKGSIKTWKDLPSEGWAEMMDLWFCHKPTVDEEDEEMFSPQFDKAARHIRDAPHDNLNKSAGNKGYGADTSFSPQLGIGLVDTMTFLLAQEDCENVVVSTSQFLCIFLVSKSGGYQEGGLALRRAPRWSGHRYKYPRLIFVWLCFSSEWSRLPSSSL